MAKRLSAEYKQIMRRKDLANFVALPEEDNIFEWHFLVFGLKECPYEHGFYHGKLTFPRDYPFRPPGIQVLTPNGRF
jgi:ubiquitin-protein ligase